MIAGLLRHLVFDVGWDADVLLIDAPPGTGDEIQAMTRDLPLSGAVFLTTPQDLAQMDAERTLTLLNERGVPVIGMVQNMAALTCPHCGEPIDLFASSARLADAGVAILGRCRSMSNYQCLPIRGCRLCSEIHAVRSRSSLRGSE